MSIRPVFILSSSACELKAPNSCPKLFISSFCFVVKFGNPKISFCIFMKSRTIALAYSEFIDHHWERTTAIELFISVPRVIFRLAGIKGNISSTPGVIKSKPLGQ